MDLQFSRCAIGQKLNLIFFPKKTATDLKLRCIQNSMENYKYLEQERWNVNQYGLNRLMKSVAYSEWLFLVREEEFESCLLNLDRLVIRYKSKRAI